MDKQDLTPIPGLGHLAYEQENTGAAENLTNIVTEATNPLGAYSVVGQAAQLQNTEEASFPYQNVSTETEANFNQQKKNGSNYNENMGYHPSNAGIDKMGLSQGPHDTSMGYQNQSLTEQLPSNLTISKDIAQNGNEEPNINSDGSVMVNLTISSDANDQVTEGAGTNPTNISQPVQQDVGETASARSAEKRKVILDMSQTSNKRPCTNNKESSEDPKDEIQKEIASSSTTLSHNDTAQTITSAFRHYSSAGNSIGLNSASTSAIFKKPGEVSTEPEEKLTEFPIKHFKRTKKKLGKGAFGTVRLFEKRANAPNYTGHLPDKVAIKKLMGNVQKDKDLKREISILEKSDHPNIVKYFGHYPMVDDEGEDKTGIAMEVCQGTVKDLVKKRQLNLIEVAYLTRQMLTGVAYLHDVLRIHHRDIKPANMLLKMEDESPITDWTNVDIYKLVLKISDFGLCHQLTESRASESINMTVVGSLHWMAPEVREAMLIEVLTKAKYSKYSDIWSCGLVAYYMFKQGLPEKDDLAKLAKDSSLKRLGFLVFLLNQLQRDRKMRLSAKKLLEQPFVTIESLLQGSSYHPLSKIFVFSVPDNLKVLVGCMKTKLSMNNRTIISTLYDCLQGNYNKIFQELFEQNAILEATMLTKENKLDGSDPNFDDWLLDNLLMSTERGETSTVKVLCEAGARVDRFRYNKTALHVASENGHLSTAEYLIKEANADVNRVDYDKTTALHLAAKGGQTDIIKLLCDNRAEINVKCKLGSTPLHKASFNGHLSTVELLLNRGAEINVQDKIDSTPLHKASLNGHVSTVELLLNRGAEINVQDNSGYTPLHWASLKGHVSTVELLLNRGAEINVQDNQGSTPLHEASVYGHVSTVELLLNRGAEIKVQDKECSTPLHKASVYGHVSTVELLLNRGAEINVQDKDGSTSLFNASYNGHLSTVELFLKFGADASIRNKEGKTAREVAANNKYCSEKKKQEIISYWNQISSDKH